MANKPRNIERIAEIIICANLRGDEAACKEYGISLRTLQSYRKLAKDDTNIAHICALKKKEIGASLQGTDWKAETVTVLRDGAKKLAEWINNLSSKPSTDEIKTLIGGMKIMGELKLQTDVLGTDASDSQSISMEENGGTHQDSASTEANVQNVGKVTV